MSANVLATVNGLVDGSITTTPGHHAASHQNGGADTINVAGLSGQLAQMQGFGISVNDTIEIPEPGVFEIPSTGFFDIIENDGPMSLLTYVARVSPPIDQCLAETSSLQVLDYYEITEPSGFEIPISALMEIAETSGARDFDIS